MLEHMGSYNTARREELALERQLDHPQRAHKKGLVKGNPPILVEGSNQPATDSQVEIAIGRMNEETQGR